MDAEDVAKTAISSVVGKTAAVACGAVAGPIGVLGAVLIGTVLRMMMDGDLDPDQSNKDSES